MRKQEKSGSTSEVARDPRSPPLESVGMTLPGQRTSTDNDSTVDEDVASFDKDVLLQVHFFKSTAALRYPTLPGAAPTSAMKTSNALKSCYAVH